MRIANVSGRLTLLTDDRHGLDVAEASGGTFAADPQAVYERWDEFAAWAAAALRGDTASAREFSPDDLGPPTPLPRQVLGIGLHYRKPWARWLTIIATASLIPLEIYECIHRLSVGRVVILVINVAVVVYLVRRGEQTQATPPVQEPPPV